jgi:hypothetical protein
MSLDHKEFTVTKVDVFASGCDRHPAWLQLECAMRRRFEFQPDDGQKIIEGKVGEKFSQDYLDRITTEQFAGRRWKARFDRRTVVKPGRLPIESHTLIELDEIE